MNDFSLTVGMNKELEFQVTKEFTAVHIGSGSISVLSTPSMILFMEIASGRLGQEHMKEGYTTVGTKVCVDHLAAVLEGETILARSTVKKLEDRKITFSVEIFHNNKLIGNGTHIRYIINEKRFLEKLTKN